MNQSPVVNAVWINNIPSDLPSRTAFSLGFRNDLEVENVREEEYSVTVNRPYKNMAFILVWITLSLIWINNFCAWPLEVFQTTVSFRSKCGWLAWKSLRNVKLKKVEVLSNQSLKCPVLKSWLFFIPSAIAEGTVVGCSLWEHYNHFVYVSQDVGWWLVTFVLLS